MYLVKWLGWPEETNTWEPLDNLDCHEQLVEFYIKRREQRNATTSLAE
jgi:hypothetical protein